MFWSHPLWQSGHPASCCSRCSCSPSPTVSASAPRARFEVLAGFLSTNKRSQSKSKDWRKKTSYWDKRKILTILEVNGVDQERVISMLGSDDFFLKGSFLREHVLIRPVQADIVRCLPSETRLCILITIVNLIPTAVVKQLLTIFGVQV